MSKWSQSFWVPCGGILHGCGPVLLVGQRSRQRIEGWGGRRGERSRFKAPERAFRPRST